MGTVKFWHVNIDGSFDVEAETFDEAMLKVTAAIKARQAIGTDGVWIQVDYWENNVNHPFIEGGTYWDPEWGRT